MDPRLLLSSSAALFFFLFCLPYSDSAPVKSSRQYLPPQPGYIPVYIQDGDVPPDVASMYGEGAAADDKGEESDVAEVPDAEVRDDSLSELRESEEFIVRQLTDTRDNEVRGIVEAVDGRH